MKAVVNAGAPVDFVDPFIGSGGDGHTTPAAAYPLGLVQAGPDTGMGDFRHCAGYAYEESRVLGFSQTHLSGTGCASLGDLRLLPLGDESVAVDDALRDGLAIDKSSEKATPGCYSTRIEGGVAVEIAAAPHSAIYRFSFVGGGCKRLVVDCQWGLVREAQQRTHVKSSEIAVEGLRGLSGRIHAKHWVEREYGFALEFDRPFDSCEELPRREGEKAPRFVLGFALRTGETLSVKVGITSGCGGNKAGRTLGERAKANLAAEIPEWDFAAVKSAAKEAWNNILKTTDVEGTEEERRAWWTALYHLYIQPNNVADVGERPFYSTLSCWDTFRAAGPLYTILSPAKAAEFVDSMLEQGKITGYLPIWALWGRDNQCMIGTHSVPMIVDLFLKVERGTGNGERGMGNVSPERSEPRKRSLEGWEREYWEEAYAQIKDTLTKSHEGRLKERWDLYDRYGYYPFDEIKGESVSRTLECAYDDWCASLMARKLGHVEDAEMFARRAGRWKNVFDPSIQLMRGKDSNGNWREPFNPFALGAGAKSENDFTEGNSYQYSWHVMHDAKGLIELMGGGDRFTEKLDNLFELPSEAAGQGWEEDCTGFIGQYIHGNEPSHHVAYFYTLAGHPEKTAERVREILDKFYAARPDGLCGNDDCGQMSAWYLFSLMGFYPLNPCGGEYVLGAPQLPRMTVSVVNGKTFTVIAKNLSRENKYVKSVTLNGKPLDGFTIRHSDIMAGGELVFEMYGPRFEENC